MSDPETETFKTCRVPDFQVESTLNKLPSINENCIRHNDDTVRGPTFYKSLSNIFNDECTDNNEKILAITRCNKLKERTNSICRFDQAIARARSTLDIESSSSPIAWLHIPPSKSTTSREQTDSDFSYISEVKNYVVKILLCLEVLTLFKYFVRLPFLNLFFPKGAHNTHGSDGARKKFAVVLVCLLILSSVYGYYSALRGCNYVVSCVTWASRYLIIARLSGKLVTFFVDIGLIIMFRAITSYFNEIPWRVEINWRRLHVEFFIVSIAMATIHTVSHVLRIVNTVSPNWTYEIYFICTGGFLWLPLLSQYTPYFWLQFLKTFQLSANFFSFEYFLKWWFRRSHIELFKFIAFFYFTHCSGDIGPLAIYVVWKFCEFQYYQEVTDCIIRFKPSRKKHEYCELITTFANKMPDDFGYYCRINLLKTFACYTQVPLEDGYTTVFKIKKCMQTDILLNYIDERYSVAEGMIKSI